MGKFFHTPSCSLAQGIKTPPCAHSVATTLRSCGQPSASVLTMDDFKTDIGHRGNIKASWPAWAIDRAPHGLERREELFSHFVKWMDQRANDLWIGKKGFELGGEAHQALVGHLLNTASNSSERRILANWWDTLIATGNSTGIWKIAFPAREVVLPDTPPVFVHGDFQLLQRYRLIEEGLFRLVCSDLHLNQLRDVLICSAVLFGGIASVGRFNSLCALKSTDLNGDSSLLWATLQIPDGRKSMRTIRWYPDSLTGTLMVRFLKTGLWTGSLGVSGQSNKLTIVLQRLGFTDWPETWSDVKLLRAVQVALLLEQMGIVAAFLSDRFITHSLPEIGLHRIAEWKIGEDENRDEHASPYVIAPSNSYYDDAPAFNPGVNFKSQREIANEVISILKRGKQAGDKLSDIQKKLREEMWPVTYYLIEWAKWRIRPGTGEKGIQPVSVLRYLRPLVKTLIYEAESEDILSLDVEEFETLYELAAANVRCDDERARVWNTLRSFHDFMFICGVPDIDFRELDGFTSEQSHGNVSANLVTEAEFGQFKAIFFSAAQDSISLAQRRVFFAAMLGFRTGLRRREVQMLLMRDYHPGPEPFLIIRPSKFATLKSNSSNRRIPLKALLPSDELGAFVAFMAQRKEISDVQLSFVFADHYTPDTPPSQARLIDPITEAFKLICGKGRANFCFHHLRHSFSNWLFLALLSSDQPELLTERAHFIDSDLLQSQHIQTIRDSLFPRLTDTPAFPDRRHLYQVAAIMGHLSPLTTLRSYLHLLDWIAMRSLDTALESKMALLDNSALGRICGLSPSAPYKKTYSTLVGQPTRFLREFIRSRGKLKKEAAPNRTYLSKELQRVLDSVNVPTLPDIRLVMTLVGRRMDLGDSIYLARNFAVSSNAIDEAYRSYMRMYAKQSVRKPKISIAKPAVPRTKKDSTTFLRIIEATERAYKNTENRKFLRLAAECLIRRTGPRTGKLYFGKRVQDAPDIVRGILLMGILPDQVKLVLRQVNSDEPENQGLARIVEDIRKSGIKVITEPLDWEARSKKSDCIRLDISSHHSAGNDRNNRSEGLVRGLNYAAMWIAFVNITNGISVAEIL